MRSKKAYCPVNRWYCSYYKDGECGIENPIKECDDFATMCDEKYDYYSDEDRTVFEYEGWWIL